MWYKRELIKNTYSTTEYAGLTAMWDLPRFIVYHSDVMWPYYNTNVTAWMGEAFNFTLETPAPLQSVTSDIVQALRESESRLPVMMQVAIGVAATSVVVVTSFLVITYVKFNK
jgi:hypothetical protein